MKNMDISLLNLKNTNPPESNIINETTVFDLNLSNFCKEFTKNEKQHKMVMDILVNLVCDEKTIKYRQDIFEDLISSDELVTVFEKILDQLEILDFSNVSHGVFEEAKFWFLFSRFKELEGYVDCISTIAYLLQGVKYKSQGILEFCEKMNALVEDPEFISLSYMVKSLNIELDQIKSITLGINLDSSLNPSEVTIVSINKTRFKDNTFLKEVLGIFAEEFDNISKIHKIDNDRKNHILYTLYKDIEKYLKPVIRDLSSALNRYTHVFTRDIVDLIPEINFYLSFINLYKILSGNGMPVCKPEVLKTQDRACNIRGVYNLNLALHMIKNKINPQENIVLNHALFSDEGRILIITGPNRGGKTVYTEAVGLAQILFQAGIFIPGIDAAMSPVDNIFTHFPADENKTTDMGRLGEESKRINEIFQKATKHSLILLNESLTSTSYSEGLYLAQGIIKTLRYLGAKAIFNTHLHELASGLDSLNNETEGDSKVLSLITGINDGKRSFKVEPGAPLGKSYAMDIAMEFGVSYEQIVDLLKRRKNTDTSFNTYGLNV